MVIKEPIIKKDRRADPSPKSISENKISIEIISEFKATNI